MWKNRLLYLAGIITLTSIYVMFIERYIFNMIFALLAGILVDYYIFRYYRDRIRITVSSRNKIDKRNKVTPVEFRIDNICSIPIRNIKFKIEYSNGFYSDISKAKLSTSVPSYDSVIHTFELYAAHYGCINLCVKEMVVYSFLGLFKKVYKPEMISSIMLVPGVDKDYNLVVPESDVDDDIYQFDENEKGNDRSEVFDIREYREGDNIRDIHWKLSSKRDFMVVKEFSKPLENEKLIYVDLGGIASNENSRSEAFLNLVDKLLEELVNISYGLIDNGIKFTICWSDRNDIVSYKPRDEYELKDVMKNLLNTKFTDESVSVYEYLRRHHKIKFDRIYYLTVNGIDDVRNSVEKITRGSTIEIIGKEKGVIRNV